jgi:aspartyl-tRNA(Asn)/glutamyl-tRNA(Gln) amidotransferase subunit C
MNERDQNTSTEHMDVAYVAHLARLHLTEDEVRRYAGPLDEILGYVRQLQAVDTTGVEPTAHARPVVNVFRDDEAGPSQDRERTLANAPASRNGLFVVPRIIE